LELSKSISKYYPTLSYFFSLRGYRRPNSAGRFICLSADYYYYHHFREATCGDKSSSATAGKLVALLLYSLQIIPKRKQPQGRVHNVISASGKVRAGNSAVAFYD
jgi:hypothetical protein